MLCEASKKTVGESLLHENEFIQLCDEYSEFNEYCAFFCEAVTLYALSNRTMDKASAHGLERFARSIREKSQHLDKWLQELHVKV